MNKLISIAASIALCSAEGAVNHVRNPSFESDEVVFKWGRMENPLEEVGNESDPRYESRFDRTHAKDGSRAWLFKCGNPMGRNLMTFSDVPVTPGKRYTFRAWYYIDGCNGPTMVWGYAHQHDKNGKTSGYHNTSHYDTTPRRWNEWVTSICVSKNSETVTVQLIFSGSMSVWVDSVEFYEDPEPPLSHPVGAILKGSEALSLAWLSPLTKAVPCGVPAGLAEGDGKVHLDAAQNEKEHFQLILSSAQDLKGVTVGFEDFRIVRTLSKCAGAESIGGKSTRVREVKFVPVKNSKKDSMNRLHPDPIVPFTGRDVTSGTNLVLLATVAVPPQAKAGVYEGALKIYSEGSEIAAVPVELRVRGFRLPDTASLKSYFYSSPSMSNSAYKRYDKRPESEINDDIHRIYREMRLTGNQAVKRPKPKWKLTNGQVEVTDWSPYENEILRLNREYGFTVFPCPFVGMIGDNSGWFKSKGRGVIKKKNGRTVGAKAPATPFGGYFDEPEGQGRVISALRQFLQYAKNRFTGFTFTWYIYDEPCYSVMETLPEIIKTFTRALPELNILIVATPYTEGFESYHTRVAGFDRNSINPQNINFKESWYYQYASTIDDFSYLRNRFYTWQVYMADGSGVLLWNVIHCGSKRKGFFNPWDNPAHRYQNAGPTLFYPPKEGFSQGTVMSMRAINIADAIEDFDYIKMYEAKLGKEAAKRLLSEVLPEPLARPKEESEFIAVRRAMADELEKTRK